MAKKLIFTLIIFCFYFLSAFSQAEINVRIKSLKASKVGLEEAYDNIQDGDKWARKGNGFISKALQFYLLAADYNMDCPELNYKIGLCYLRGDHKEKAIDYIKAAYSKNTNIAHNMLYVMGEAYQYKMEFDNAIDQYNAYFKSLPPKVQKSNEDKVNKRIQECQFGKDLVQHPARVVIKNLGDSINSKYDDFEALSFHNDSAMYFTSSRPYMKKQKPNYKTGYFREDIYASQIINKEWNKAVRVTGKGLDPKHNQGVVWVSEDGNTRYIYNGYRNNGDIFVQVFKKNKWGSLKKMNQINSSGSESDISITKDGNTIYFVSDKSKDNLGGKDIYYCTKNKNGKWDNPTNVGSVINTPYNEEGVYISPDGNVMYFSSEGHNSMGGYDIFRSEKDANGIWTTPVNLGYPINTPDNEIFYKPTLNEKIAYYSALHSDGKGGYDLYKVIYLGKQKELVLVTDTQLIAYFENPIPEIFIRFPEEVKIDTSIFLKGFILDAKTKVPLVAKLDLIDVEKSQVIATAVTDSTGSYRIKLPELKNYGVEIHAKDYMFFLDIIKLPVHIQGREVSNDFALNKVEVGTKIVLKNIYFDLGKASLKPESNSELDKVVKFLQDNPELKIEISGHTDNVGSVKANMQLSEARAKSVVDYLIANGVPQERLVYKGYASTQPIAPNTTSASRQLNRRVEFKVLSKE